MKKLGAPVQPVWNVSMYPCIDINNQIHWLFIFILFYGLERKTEMKDVIF